MRTRLAMSVSAVLFGVGGLALLFAPDETMRIFGASLGGPMAQLLGAAWLGFAAANWTARGMALGGIYGRAVVAGNQVHAFIGAMVLARAVLAGPAIPAIWGLAAVYTLAAAYFSGLMFLGAGSSTDRRAG